MIGCDIYSCMLRKSRIDAPGALHHIICRGIERGNVFQDDFDRDQFVERLGKVLLETSTRCYVWALIANHVHLLLATGKVPVATTRFWRRGSSPIGSCTLRGRCVLGFLIIPLTIIPLLPIVQPPWRCWTRRKWFRP